MDIGKLIALAIKLKLPALALDIVTAVETVKTNAARAQAVLTTGERAELDAIHVEALVANSDLDAALERAK